METKLRWADLAAEAFEIDANLRRGLSLDKTPYLHMWRMPLLEAVAYDEGWLEAERDRLTGSARSARDTVGCETH